MRLIEMLFAVLTGIPLLFLGFCVLYLLRLLFHAILLRPRLLALTPKQVVKTSALSSPVRFVVLFPAHNEALILGEVLEGLKTLEYPSEYYRILVIADNCTDETATIARQKGVLVWERENPDERGKGYALQWAIDRLNGMQEREPEADPALKNYEALVICDADTLLSSNLLHAFSKAIGRGGKVLQARYEVLNVNESWRTRLMSCALALVHIVKPLGREHLGLSEGLKGNGMAFVREICEKITWSGASITEDIEYSLRLCREGHRVQFVPDAAVWAQMPTTAAQSRSQRQRWEGGRYHLMFSVAPKLFRESLATRSRILRDRAIELWIPPFAEMFALPTLFLGISLACGYLGGLSIARHMALIWGILLLLQALYLFVGMWVARVPASVALSVLGAPFYILWKFGVYGTMLLHRSAGGWKRTERKEL